MSELKGYWGKYKMVNGKSIIVWCYKIMTRAEMLERDDTYRHEFKQQ